ncbi:hypothetical protein AM1_4241 [Acaryochloris marina MBIC11017]|uniref:Uncharacterized protein n=1 Tax=Acaryochloris marina (strain MBIC 11017) TaxID=329726 RepID=B0CCQ9_ACAM1|nr:hypothetical protein AM1_4241 [Acaryochloris marina MBIC11017]
MVTQKLDCLVISQLSKKHICHLAPELSLSLMTRKGESCEPHHESFLAGHQ